MGKLDEEPNAEPGPEKNAGESIAPPEIKEQSAPKAKKTGKSFWSFLACFAKPKNKATTNKGVGYKRGDDYARSDFRTWRLSGPDVFDTNSEKNQQNCKEAIAGLKLDPKNKKQVMNPTPDVELSAFTPGRNDPKRASCLSPQQLKLERQQNVVMTQVPSDKEHEERNANGGGRKASLWYTPAPPQNGAYVPGSILKGQSQFNPSPGFYR